MPDPIELTSIPLPFDSPYVIKTGRIQGRIPYPYLLRNDDFKIGLPPEITIEEITKDNPLMGLIVNRLAPQFQSLMGNGGQGVKEGIDSFKKGL